MFRELQPTATVEINGTVQICGIQVKPGDIACADEAGGAFIPSAGPLAHASQPPAGSGGGEGAAASSPAMKR